MVKPISIRLDDELNEALERYVLLKETSKANFIRSAIIEKLKDDYDVVMANQTYEKWEKKGKVTISIEEMLERYG
ncbi:type II toxin-antitoxin system RelB family antitoxin [Aerococcus urinaeequi]|uniref:type II toxin-antitoxin system RelB family antitoxin n=1 Tax=Aerococcus urinaeequi TaxID=51665 RepID=UPI003B3ADA49